MPWRAFAAATAIGILPATLIYTYFADALLSAGVSHEAALAKIARLSVALLALVLASLVPTIARRLGWLPLVLAVLGPRAAGTQAIPDHAAFTAILRDHVREGRVDYGALRADSARLRAYLDELAATDSGVLAAAPRATQLAFRSEEHRSELQSLAYLVCRLLLEKKKNNRLLLEQHTARQYHTTTP